MSWIRYLTGMLCTVVGASVIALALLGLTALAATVQHHNPPCSTAQHQHCVMPPAHH